MRELAAALFTCVALVACGENGDSTATVRGEERTAAVSVGAEDLAVVEEGSLQRGPLVSGRLAPEQQATVRAEVGGSVVAVLAEPGEDVREGAVLARLDAAALRDQMLSARSAVSSAQTSLEVARREAERMRTLVEAGAAAEQQHETARRNATAAAAQLADAEARLALAREQIAQTTVRSPITGTISERPVNAGDVVQPGTALFTVVDPSSMRLEGAIPAGQLTEVDVGDPVQFEVTGYPDRTFEGQITRINPTADPATGQVRLFASIPNAEGDLVGGLFARGRISVEQAAGLIVPASAIGETEGQPMVAIVRNNIVRHLPVEIVLRDPLAERVLIRDGLQPGDVVLLGAAQGLTEGTEVRIPSRAPAS
jgi:RND family efflux transporter MFP subunit